MNPDSSGFNLLTPFEVPTHIFPHLSSVIALVLFPGRLVGSVLLFSYSLNVFVRMLYRKRPLSVAIHKRCLLSSYIERSVVCTGLPAASRSRCFEMDWVTGS